MIVIFFLPFHMGKVEEMTNQVVRKDLIGNLLMLSSSKLDSKAHGFCKLMAVVMI